MVQSSLIKHSPLQGVYQTYPVQRVNVNGWDMAEHFGNPQREQQQLQIGSVLVDWSHIGKISISGKFTAEVVEAWVPGAAAMPVLSSLSTMDYAILRLTPNDYFILSQSGLEAEIVGRLEGDRATLINQTGAMGCFALGGPRRDEVLERSTAMDLRRDRVGVGAVVQTTIHTIRCTFLRMEHLDIIVHPRSLSESLFDALLDVGMGVGLIPGGLLTIPVRLQAGLQAGSA